MRILIDLQGVQTQSKHRGIGRYSLALAEAMLRQPRGHEFWVVSNADMERDKLEGIASLLPRERFVTFRSVQPAHWRDPANAWRRHASERIREAFLQDLQPDLVHVSSLMEGAQEAAVTSIGVRPCPGPTAATLYDLIPLHDPSYLNADWVRQWYASKLESLERAEVLLAISEYVRQDALETLRLRPNVVNISSAASETFRPVPVSDLLRARLSAAFGIRGKYLIYSGAMDPRKNLERLLAAYAALPGRLLSQHQLVIVGGLSELEKGRLALVARRLGVAPDRIVLTGHVSDEQLVELYCGAELFVFPSLQEGFGLPALEAMSCGTAVIGSALTSIPEVIGRRDALFDPTDVGAIAGAIQRVLDTPEFARDLRAHGLRQASTFSWSATAARALDAFESCHRQRTSPRPWRALHADMQANEAALVKELVHDLSTGNAAPTCDLMAAAAAIAANQETALEALRRMQPLPSTLSWRVEGPFDSSYSLALVNREIALALHREGVQVALHCTDGDGDFEPDPAFLTREPEIADLHRRAAALDPTAADVSSRLLYPPRVQDMSSRFNLLHAYAWEESELPCEWVDDFNEFLQGASALSAHVKKVLIDNGVGLPISVCGAGVDHWRRAPAHADFELKARRFRFLHVSSCLPRKGVDVLLQAYGDAFSEEDDVSLVIKTFANPQNQVERWLAAARASRPGFPHVEIIEEDLSDAQLQRLYSQCHVMVAPSRAEGFGLPMAEAMMSGLAVITTGWGGQCDFCTPETAWLLDYEFASAATLFDLPESVWAEPSRAHLASLLRELHSLGASERAQRVRRGEQLLRAKFGWGDVARQLIGFTREVAALPMAATAPSVAWVGPWQQDCAVTAHALGLVGQMDARIFRLAWAAGAPVAPVPELEHCWRPQGPDALSELDAQLDVLAPDVVVLQLHRGLVQADRFSALVERQKRHDGRVVVAMLHGLAGEEAWESSTFRQALQACDRVLVPAIGALNVLRAHGIVNNAAILPYGMEDAAMAPGESRTAVPRRVLAVTSGACDRELQSLIGAIGRLRLEIGDASLVLLADTPPPNADEPWISACTDEQELADVAAVVLIGDAQPDGLPLVARRALALERPVLSISERVAWPFPVQHLEPDAARRLVDALAASFRGQGWGAEQRFARWRDARRYSRLGRRLWNMMKAIAWDASARRATCSTALHDGPVLHGGPVLPERANAYRTGHVS